MGPVIHTHIPTMQYIMPTVLTNLCPVEAPQCNEQVFEIERHISPTVFCIIVGAVQRSKLLKKQVLRNAAVDGVLCQGFCIDCVQIMQEPKSDPAQDFEVWKQQFNGFLDYGSQ